jgi:hypothetical protein
LVKSDHKFFLQLVKLPYCTLLAYYPGQAPSFAGA